MYGSEKNIKHNLFLFFMDGVVFQPSMTLISITTVIPYFLAQLGASTFQIALAASIALICTFMAQPIFGYLATHAKVMHKTFGKILLLQRSIFFIFVLCIPALIKTGAMFVWIFLFFWGLFNVFVGAYNVFHTPLVITLLPPEKRGAIRGLGYAIGSCLGLGAAALITVLLGRISFPHNYVAIFSLGLLFLFIDAFLFFFMRVREHIVPDAPTNIVRYFKEMLSSIRENVPFRTVILTCLFLVIANSLLPYYTLYAIRVFSITESFIAALAALAVISNAFGYIIIGVVVDRWGPKTSSVIAAILIILAGAFPLVTNSLILLSVAWVFANLGNTGYMISATLLLGEVSPPSKLPQYVGVQATISLAISSTILLLLAPVLENIGFFLLFATVFVCGVVSLLINLLVLRKQLKM